MHADWYYHRATDMVRLGYNKLTGKRLNGNRYADRIVIDENGASELLAEKVNSRQAWMACRYGYVELETMAAVYRYLSDGNGRMLGRIIDKGAIFNNAGFFPADRTFVIEFGKLMLECCQQADMFGVWHIPYEEYFLRTLTPNAILTPLRTYEPWNERIPWTYALQGKKVLVIHPFAETIRKQYLRRKLLFSDERILPEFEMTVLPAVQTIAGLRDDRFDTWFAALDYMTEEALKRSFDVAIIGCGAYGFPLAANIKKAGRCAVHMGGATQLLFGIKGKRWEKHHIISKLMNDSWVSPSAAETPKRKDLIEQGCYW